MQVSLKVTSVAHAARHELLEHEELEHHPEVPGYTLAELQIKYKKPLRSQDIFLATVSVVKESRVKVDFHQRIIRLDQNDPSRDQVRPQC
jgi:acyl-CoA thioesterase FadM